MAHRHRYCTPGTDWAARQWETGFKVSIGCGTPGSRRLVWLVVWIIPWVGRELNSAHHGGAVAIPDLFDREYGLDGKFIVGASCGGEPTSG